MADKFSNSFITDRHYLGLGGPWVCAVSALVTASAARTIESMSHNVRGMLLRVMSSVHIYFEVLLLKGEGNMLLLHISHILAIRK